jgi:uncharacterized protein (TIGR03067 family)
MHRLWLLRSLSVVIVGAFFVVATNGPIAKGQEDAETLKEEKRLSGLWRIEVFEWDGQRITAKESKDKSSDIFELRWLPTTTKAEAVVVADVKVEWAKYKLNLRAKPKTVDIQAYGATFKGIYSIDDKTLKACFSVRNPLGKKPVPGKENRPTDFTTKEKSERLLLILVRDEKAKK